LKVFRSESRESRPPPRRSSRCSLAEIIEKGCRIGVAFIDLKPKAGNFADLKVACNQSGLATTRRPRNPDRRLLSQPIQMAKQPLPGKDSCDEGRGDFTHG